MLGSFISLTTSILMSLCSCWRFRGRLLWRSSLWETRKTSNIAVYQCLVSLIRPVLFTWRRVLLIFDWAHVSTALRAISVVFITYLFSIIVIPCRNSGFLAHLEQVLPMRLYVTVHLVAIWSHWALAAERTVYCITTRLWCLKGWASSEWV